MQKIGIFQTENGGYLFILPLSRLHQSLDVNILALFVPVILSYFHRMCKRLQQMDFNRFFHRTDRFCRIL